MLPKAIPFDLIDGFSISLVFQKLDIQSFPEKRPELLMLAGRSYKVCRQLKGHFFTINAPRPLILPKKNKIKNIYIFQAFSSRFSLSLLSLISLPNTSKHLQTPQILILSLQSSRQCSCTQSSSPWFHTLDLRFKGVDVAFQLQSTPFSFISFFQLFLSYYSFQLFLLLLFLACSCFLACLYSFYSIFPCLCYDLSL